MAVRDFRQIKPTDNDKARRILSSAGQSFNKGFDVFNKLVSDQEKLEKKNYQAGIKRNDAAIQADLQKFDSLGGFNQARQEGSFNLDSLKNQYGVQYSQDKVPGLIDQQRDELRRQAESNAIKYGRGVAQETGDTNAGAQAVTQKLMDAGMQANLAMAAGKEAHGLFGNLKDQFAKDRQAAVRKSVDNAPKFNNNEEMLQYVAANSDIRTREALLTGLNEKEAYQQEDFNEEVKAISYNAIKQAQAQGRPAREVVMENIADLPEKDQTAVLDSFVTDANKLNQKTENEQKSIEAFQSGLANERSAIELKYNHKLGTLKSQIDAYAPIDTSAAQRLIGKNEKNFNGLFTALDSEIGLGQGTDKERLKEYHTELKKLPNVNEQMATTILAQAVANTMEGGFFNLKAWGGKDINANDIIDYANIDVNQFAAKASLQSEYADTQMAMQKDLLTHDTRSNERILKAQTGWGSSSNTGSSTAPTNQKSKGSASTEDKVKQFAKDSGAILGDSDQSGSSEKSKPAQQDKPDISKLHDPQMTVPDTIEEKRAALEDRLANEIKKQQEAPTPDKKDPFAITPLNPINKEESEAIKDLKASIKKLSSNNSKPTKKQTAALTKAGLIDLDDIKKTAANIWKFLNKDPWDEIPHTTALDITRKLFNAAKESQKGAFEETFQKK